jgi:hypothetical protein
MNSGAKSGAGVGILRSMSLKGLRVRAGSHQSDQHDKKSAEANQRIDDQRFCDGARERISAAIARAKPNRCHGLFSRTARIGSPDWLTPEVPSPGNALFSGEKGHQDLRVFFTNERQEQLCRDVR